MSWLDEILQEATVGENFVSYTEIGQAKADKAKKAIEKHIHQREIEARIDEAIWWMDKVKKINNSEGLYPFTKYSKEMVERMKELEGELNEKAKTK